jgi:hypothetical protein
VFQKNKKNKNKIKNLPVTCSNQTKTCKSWGEKHQLSNMASWQHIKKERKKGWEPTRVIQRKYR